MGNHINKLDGLKLELASLERAYNKGMQNNIRLYLQMRVVNDKIKELVTQQWKHKNFQRNLQKRVDQLKSAMYIPDPNDNIHHAEPSGFTEALEESNDQSAADDYLDYLSDQW